jgi:hypothetical protein
MGDIARAIREKRLSLPEIVWRQRLLESREGSSIVIQRDRRSAFSNHAQLHSPERSSFRLLTKADSANSGCRCRRQEAALPKQIAGRTSMPRLLPRANYHRLLACPLSVLELHSAVKSSLSHCCSDHDFPRHSHWHDRDVLGERPAGIHLSVAGELRRMHRWPKGLNVPEEIRSFEPALLEQFNIIP